MKIVFEQDQCYRCDGSGSMPFSLHNGVCFKCKGSGKIMTSKGRRAYDKMKQIQREMMTVPASSLKPGDKIVDSSNKVRVVKDVEVSLGRGNVSSPNFVQYGKSVIVCNGWSMSMAAHADVMKAWDAESLERCAEALKNYKGAKVIV